MDLYGVSQVTALARDRGYVTLEGQQIDNVKGFYKKFRADFNAKVNEIIEAIGKLN